MLTYSSMVKKDNVKFWLLKDDTGLINRIYDNFRGK